MRDSEEKQPSGHDSEGITRLLIAWSRGDLAALEALIPRIYSDLRRLAHAQLRPERSDHTLQPTALVHEALIRLMGQHSCRWQSRGHFFALAARMMRRVLVDYARCKHRDKRGRGVVHVPCEQVPELAESDSPWRVLVVDHALTGLAERDPELVRLVELRFFAGCTVAETATALGISERSVRRRWAIARHWLGGHLRHASG